MKKLLVAILVVALWSVSAAAQVTPGSALLTLGGGWSGGTLKESGASVDGGMIGISYERLAPDKSVSFITSLGYSSMDASEEDPTDGRVSRSVDTIPFALGARAWLGQSRLQFNAGALIAIYFSKVHTTYNDTGNSYQSMATSGWGMQIPLGVSFSLTESVVLSAAYQLNWMWSNDAFDKDLLNVAIIGLGFKMD